MGGGERGVNCANQSTTWLNTYRTPGHWAASAITPLKTVLVNFVICRNSQGENGWQNTPAMIADFEELIDEVNLKYASPGTVGWPMTCPPSISYIPDSKIRFELNNVYFLDNDAYNSYSSLSPPTALLEELWATHPDSRGALNHIWTQPDTWGGGWWGYYGTYQGESFVLTRNAMWGTSSVYTKHHVSHEYGHAVGLHHTYDGEVLNTQHFDFLDDLFGTCPEPLVMDAGNPCYPAAGAPCSPATNYVCYLKASCFFVNYPNAMPPLMSGMDNNQYISPKCSGRMHRSLSLYNNTFVVNNTPMHKYVKEKYSYAIPFTVSANETWDFAIKMYQDIVVEAPATLTLSCEVRMPINGRIIVKPGAKLVIDGGVVTCAHDGELWQGIQAWGTTNQHQYPANNPTYQGLVILKNGAVIEHALTGVSCGDPLLKSAQGGVVQVQGSLNDVGATFRNCRVGVEFKKYRNFLPSNSTITKDNNSYFQHAEFIVDDNYRGNDDFDAHARLNKVQGINFIQCDFINSQVSGPLGINSSALLGRGIFSLDASFRVSGQCAELLPACELGSGQPVPVCPDASLRPSRFIGLDHGIRVGSSSTSSFGYSVKDSYFENNVCGIYTDAVNNGSILRNRFVVGGREVDLTVDDVYFQGLHRGIYGYNTNAFKIEENRFSKPTSPHAEAEGVVVSSTGAYNNQVYKNTATGVDYGFIAENNNVDYVHPTATGLSFICNQNVQNGEEDLTVRSTSGSPGPDHCIKIFQGSTTKSAGNTFTTQQNGSSLYYNFHNAAEVLPITYYWELPPGDLNTGAYNAPWVQRNANASPHNTCPTQILCGGGTGPVQLMLTPQIEQERLAYLNLKYVYESLLDGGDFDELKETIMLSWPQDAWALRNELMAKSPYLSTDILKEAGLKNTLPHAMYLEVCVANPEATQRDGFAKWVQYEMPNPLPEYMVAQMMASWDQKTWRTSLEADMGWHNGEYQRLNDELITTMLNDTVAQPADSLLTRWQLNPSLRARFGEVNVLLENNRFDEAVALLQGLDADYLLEKQGMQDRNYMLDLIAVIRPVIEGGGRTLMQLEPGELTALEGIAARQPSLASSYARNTLCYGYNICIPPVTGGASHPKKMLVSLPGTVAAPTPVLIVHPNPASTWVAFSHTLPGKVDQVRIRVVDPLGRVVNERAIGASPGQEVWDTRGTAAGSYTVELYNAGGLVDAQRVVVKP